MFSTCHTPLQEEDPATATGKITSYKVSVHSRNSGLVFSTNVSAGVRNCTVPFGPGCVVTVWSCTSKGCSPPATISRGYTKGGRSSFHFCSLHISSTYFYLPFQPSPSRLSRKQLANMVPPSTGKRRKLQSNRQDTWWSGTLWATNWRISSGSDWEVMIVML